MKHAAIAAAAVGMILCGTSQQALAAAAATTTTLAISSGSAPVPAGTVVTLTATVVTGTTPVPVTPGIVKFCDASVIYCTDIHLTGTAQLTSVGKASISFVAGSGSHSYKAVFAGTTSYRTSFSSVTTLNVNPVIAAGIRPTASTITQSGSVGSGYTLTATVAGTSPSGLGGTVSFLDTTNSFQMLGNAALSGLVTAPGLSTSASFSPAASLIGDFNGDGKADVVAISDNVLVSDTVLVELGDGEGGFSPAAGITLAQSIYYVALGDFNGDGKLDLAVVLGGVLQTDPETLTVLLGNGDGTFTISTGASSVLSNNVQAISVGDFNNDGNLDVATVNGTDDTVTILKGDGHGAFTVAAVYPTGYGPNAIAVGDLNNDGKLDLVVPNSNDSLNTYTVLLGSGSCTFAVNNYSIGSVILAQNAVLGDFNSDGNLDLVIADNFGSTYVLPGAGNGTFGVPIATLSTVSSPNQLAVGDFNGDGLLDLAIQGDPTQSIPAIIEFGDGTGAFTDGPIQTEPAGYVLVSGDFNGDGLTDLMVEDVNGQSDVLLLGVSQMATATLGPISVAGAAGSTHQVEAKYGGDASNAASTSTTTGLTATPAPTTLALSADPISNTYGKPVTLTAVLSPYLLGSYTTTGVSDTVTFYSDGASLGTGVLSGGKATLSVSSLPAGPAHSLTARFLGDTYFSASPLSNAVSYHVTQARLTVTAGNQAMTYGGVVPSLTGTLVGVVAGDGITATYTTTATSISAAGSYLITATLNDPNSKLANYTVTITAATLVIGKATPAIAWAVPSAIAYGTALSSAQLNASSTVAGSSFNYSPGLGTVLGAGPQTLSVTFTPTDTTDYNPVTTTVSLVVTQAGLTVTAGNQAMTYGGVVPVLTGTLVGAVAGDGITATYTTTATSISTAGSYPITATLNDPNSKLANYAVTNTAGTLVIGKATPAITWLAPAAITYGTGLSSAQLNASSTVAGTSFNYSPGPGTVFGAGPQTLSVTFTPTDTTDYNPVTTTVSLVVMRAPLTVTAGNETMTYGGAVPTLTGTLAGVVTGDGITATYATAATSVSTAGSYPITATLNDPNSKLANYAVTNTAGTLVIGKATPSITWPTPSAITYGTVLGAAQLNATSTVAGSSFNYSPGPGTLLGAGSQTLTVTFTPADTSDFTSATATATILVNPASQSITFSPPTTPVTYGVGQIALIATGGASGNAVTFTATGPATVSGNLLTITGAGTVVVTASQAGNSNYLAAATAQHTITVAQAAAGIQVASNSNPSLVKNAVTLTATMNSTAGAPTGTVTFLDGVTPLGTGTLTANVASLTTSALSAGSHSITAAYGGDANFIASASGALTQLEADFSLASTGAGGPSATAAPGTSAVFTFLLSPVGSTTFPAEISLSAIGLPSGATFTFSPVSQAAGTGATTVTLTVRIPQAVAGNAQSARPASKPASRIPIGALALLLLPFAGGLRRVGRKLGRGLPLLLLLVAGLATVASVSGCGGSSSGGSSTAATYGVQVTGTSGALAHTAYVTLIVQ